MRFEVLGPLRVVAPVGTGAGRAAPNERALGGPKQRLVIALLLAEPNSVVSVERLIDGLWGEAPPDTARHTLQSYVSELRKAVGDVIERIGAGYSIRVDADSLDALELEARVSEARALLDEDPGAAAAGLDAALALWRGRPFEDHPDQPSLQTEATRLDELHLAATEALLTARLALGQHADVVADLERITRAHPYREGLRALHMVALYRSGRQADALRAFQATRAVLAEDLGIDPSPRLRRLEEQILLQDPDLDLPSGADGRRGPSGVVENPYMGLRAFREPDAGRFFGHDRLVDLLAERITGGTPFTAVVGPSGSGKSSAVQAGLLPRLRQDRVHLTVAMMQPGTQPFAELEAALAAGVDAVPPSLARLRSSPSGLVDAITALLGRETLSHLLLVVDQFEELFTVAEPEQAGSFIDALVHLAADRDARVQVLVTMRADFYDRPLAHPTLGALFADNVVNVVPLGPEELEAAATLPARALDVGIEPRLINRLIVDVAGQPNALPLFQYALTELFDERTGPVLDLATYERIGGVRKAVARRAESLYSHLDGPEQQAVRQLFLRIATVSGDVVGRRRVPASELAALDVDVVALQHAIDSFTRYRLLALDRDPTTGAPTVELAHEALLAEWHRLRDWVEESREDLTTHARFVVALNEWESAGRDAGYLLSGARLDGYEAWAASSRMQLTETEQTLIDASIALREAQCADERDREVVALRLRRRTRGQLVALFVASALLAGIVAYPILTAEPRPERIAIALSSDRETSGFDELLARSVEVAAEGHGFEATVAQPPYSSLDQTQADLAADAPLVFGTMLMWDSMIAAAAARPDTTFVFLDQVGAPPVPNGIAVSLLAEEGSFLVGAAAALESTTGKIGFIGANASPIIEPFRAGFEQGAVAARPGIEIVSALISPVNVGDGYAHRDRARAIAEWMYTELDVDIIFTAAGGSGTGVIEAATDLSDDVGRHLWAIGVDTDFLFELPAAQREHLLTSMIKRFELGVEPVVAAYEAGTLVAPSQIRLGVREGAVDFSTSGDHLQPETVSAMRSFADRIASGDLPVEPDPSGPIRAAP